MNDPRRLAAMMQSMGQQQNPNPVPAPGLPQGFPQRTPMPMQPGMGGAMPRQYPPQPMMGQGQSARGLY